LPTVERECRAGDNARRVSRAAFATVDHFVAVAAAASCWAASSTIRVIESLGPGPSDAQQTLRFDSDP
jgi:hypothetical protein